MSDVEVIDTVDALPEDLKCQFCGKSFTRKNWFDKHSCAKKKKFERLDEITLHRAYRLFTHWMKVQGLIKRGKPPSLEKFKAGRYSLPFVELSNFILDGPTIQSGYDYVEWLVGAKINISKWCDRSSPHMEKYYKYQRLHDDPVVHANKFRSFIKRWMKDHPGASVTQFYDDLKPADIYTMTQSGDLLPWVLFAHQPIMNIWLGIGDHQFDEEVFHRINDLHNCGYWANRADDETLCSLMDNVLSDMK